MNGYEKLIKTMRQQASHQKKTYPLKLGTMLSENECQVGELKLDKDDLLVSEHLLHKLCEEVKGEIESSSGETHTHVFADKSKYLEALKKDDVVIVMQVSGDTFIIIDKVVSL